MLHSSAISASDVCLPILAWTVAHESLLAFARRWRMVSYQ